MILSAIAFRIIGTEFEMYICIAACRVLDQSCDDGGGPDNKCCNTDPATNKKLECKNFKCIKKAGTSSNPIHDKM